MPIQLTGLGGFDSTGVVSQLVDLASKPLTDIDKKKSLVDSASVTLNSFTSRLNSLKTAATALSTTSGFTSMAASSSDTALVPSVTGSAVASSYTVNVTQLARGQKSRSGAQTSATTALGQAGDMTIQIGSGTPLTISVLATDSLSDIASKISQSGGRLNASVINSGGAYHLSVQGLDSGADNSFTIGEGGTVSLGFANPASVIETAQNAMLTVDGLPITRPTNQISEAIPGVTLALTKTTTSPATLRVSGDSSALKAKVSAFMSAYNDVLNASRSATGYGSAKASNSVLAADSTVRGSVDKISRMVTGAISGASASYGSLAMVGLNLGKDGLMTFDASKFDAALEKDSNAVARLFVTDTSTGATGVMKSVADNVTGLVTGDSAPIKTRIDALTAQSRRLAESRVAKEKRVTAYEQQLRKQFSDLDLAMSRYQSMSGMMSGLTKY